MDILSTPLKTCDACGISFPPKPNRKLSQVEKCLSRYPGNLFAAEHDIASIEDHIHGAEEEILAYDSELARVQNILEELQARRDMLSRATRQLKSITRPSIRRLPVEILLDIFLWYCDDEDQGLLPALCLGSVCSQWRNIAHSSPALWATIRCRGLRKLSPRKFLPLVRYCLEKSRAVPLEVSIRSSDGTEAFTELAKHSDRWKQLMINLNNLPRYSLPVNLLILEGAHFFSNAKSNGGYLRHTLPAQVNTPALQELTLGYDELASGTRFNTSSLTILSVRGEINFSSLVALLRQCPKLSTLALEDVNPTNLVGGTGNFRILPITSLIVTHFGENDFHRSDPIFGYFTFPRLENLILLDISCPSIHRDMDLFRLLTGSQPPPLVSLDITKFGLHLDNLLDMLTALSPTLSRIRFAVLRSFLHQKFFEIMTLSNHPALLPHLKELKVTDVDQPHFDSLLGMVESRWRVEESPTQKRLSRFGTTCRSGELADMLKERLAGFSSQGLQVEVSISTV
ncbi:hypothetical protein V5O48_014740 [Marasmius crinis-equi]|uniref:F-box domain-containing protein n=1 Tax=Marasmius crinis-equi TaxID=585013 RepID=A0ABR3EWF6_9AGAR